MPDYRGNVVEICFQIRRRVLGAKGWWHGGGATPPADRAPQMIFSPYHRKLISYLRILHQCQVCVRWPASASGGAAEYSGEFSGQRKVRSTAADLTLCKTPK